jgi:dihydroorotase
VFDPETEELLEPATLRSRGQNSPFIGWALPGRVTHTLLKGRVVYAREE